jgi:predicted amidohydrolase YtcJ
VSARIDLLVNGRTATLAGKAGPAFVEAIAIGAGRVVAAGSRDEVGNLAGRKVRRLDIGPDQIAIPGLTDAHLHLADAALASERVELAGAATVTEGLRRIRSAHDRLRDPEAWLEGGGWDPGRWGAWPIAAELEAAAPGRRAALWAHDHHAMWASPAALAAAGIDERTGDPPGGVIRRGADGTPTGVLHESAAGILTAIVPRPSGEEIEAAIERFVPLLHRHGLVAVHDPGEIKADATLEGGFAAYRRLAAAGRLKLRVHACIRQDALSVARDRELRSGQLLGPDPLMQAHVGWLKLFADGTVGSRTAALLEPYEPEAGGVAPPGGPRGLFVTPPELLHDLAEQAAAVGIATTIHAIGDAAVRVALDALAPTVGLTPLMPRIEHIQLADPRDIARFPGIGIAASVQPIHLHGDGDHPRRAWGNRVVTRGYPWWQLVRAGAVMPFGSDAPVEPIDPWPAILMALTPRPVQLPGETRPRMRALRLGRVLRSACLDPAISAGERDRGRLTRGSRANVVVVEAADLAQRFGPGEARLTVRPQLVLMDGEEVFAA